MLLKVSLILADPMMVTIEEPTAAINPPQQPGQAAVPPVAPPVAGPPILPSSVMPGVPAPGQPAPVVPPVHAAAQLPSIQAPQPSYGPREAVVGQPVLLDQLSQSSATQTAEIVRKSNTGMRLGLAGVLLAVTSLGGFAVKTALTEPAGPETPEAAMEAFFEAFANEDMVGMAETLLPSEREAYIDPLLSITDELERLEAFGKDVEIDSLGNLEVTIDGLVVQSSPLADGFATVESTSGVLHVIGGVEDVEALARVGEWLGEDLEPASDEITDLAQDPLEMVAVEEDGVWYLSLVYTMAEEARKDAEKPLPSFGAGPTPVGGATPEAAIENFVNEMVDLDLEGMLTQLDPEEMRAAYDYAPLFIGSTQSELDGFLDELRAEGVTWGVEDLQLHTDDSRGRTIVLVDGATFEASFDGNHITLAYAGKCVSIRGSGEELGDVNETFCEGDELGPDGISPLVELGLDHVEFPEFGITVVQRGDNWYISSAPTVLYSFVDMLAVLEPADIEALKDAGSDAFDQLSQLDPFAFGDLDQGSDMQYTETGDVSVDTEGGYANGDDDDYETNFVEVNPDLVPEGLDAYSEDTRSWWFSIETGTEEPISVMSVWSDDSWLNVGEYSSPEAAIAAMNRLSDEYVGDQDQATDSFNVARRSGRFVVTYWGGEEATALAELVAQHLADQ